MLTETEFHDLSLSRFRYEEAKHFLQEYARYSSPPLDWYFGMIASFDAFLFCFVSIEELISRQQKEGLKTSLVFMFLKALRNVTTHQSVLAAPEQVKFERPFTRHITEGPEGASARLKFDVPRCRTMFAVIATDSRAQQQVLTAAENYLQCQEATGRTDFFLEDVLDEGLEEVSKLLGFL